MASNIGFSPVQNPVLIHDNVSPVQNSTLVHDKKTVILYRIFDIINFLSNDT